MKNEGCFGSLGLVLLVLFAVLISLKPCAGLYAKNGPVVPLSPANFHQLVIQSDVVSVVSAMLISEGSCGKVQ